MGKNDHGDPNTYKNWACRCTPCREAWNADCARKAAEKAERDKKKGKK